MLHVVTNDGLELLAKNASELVSMLHSASYSQSDSDRDWMRETAARTEEQTGSVIRFARCEDFIRDLINLGLLKELDS